MSSVETFRRELKKWRHMFELDDVWTFEVEESNDTKKLSVEVNYRTHSARYTLNDSCPFDEMDLDLLAFRQAICWLVSYIILSEMDNDDEEDADAEFHRAMLRTSEALTRALGLVVLTNYKRLEQIVRESLQDKEGHA